MASVPDNIVFKAGIQVLGENSRPPDDSAIDDQLIDDSGMTLDVEQGSESVVQDSGT